MRFARPSGRRFSLFQSLAAGVGHNSLQDFHFCIDGANWFAFAVGVANNPDSVSTVGSIDGTSRNNKRPAGVAETFQVSEHFVEPQGNVASNVLANDPSGSRECNDSAHLRPEIAVIFMRSLRAGVAEGLTGITAADEVDRSEPTQSACIKGVNVFKAGNARPVLGEDGLAELVSLTEGNGSHASSLEPEGEAANAAEEIEDIQRSLLCARGRSLGRLRIAVRSRWHQVRMFMVVRPRLDGVFPESQVRLWSGRTVASRPR
jgi:hypothetical protein